MRKAHNPVLERASATWLDQDDDMGLRCTHSDQLSTMVAVSGRSAIGRLEAQIDTTSSGVDTSGSGAEHL
jgi:hypothetical protein